MIENNQAIGLARLPPKAEVVSSNLAGCAIFIKGLDDIAASRVGL